MHQHTTWAIWGVLKSHLASLGSHLGVSWGGFLEVWRSILVVLGAIFGVILGVLSARSAFLGAIMGNVNQTNLRNAICIVFYSVL